MIIRALVLVSLAACAGATPASDTFVNQPGSGSGSGSGSAGSGGMASGGDATFDSGPTDVPGLLFEPIALGLPGMPMVTAKKKMAIEGHRAAFDKAKDPVVKQAEAEIIATMLYEQSKKQTGDERKKTLTDARQVLRDAATAVGPAKIDDSLLRMLGSYDIELEDYAPAEQDWSQLVTKAPKDKDEPYNRAWWIYSLLRQFKTQDAVAALGTDAIIEKQPELAYTAAWAKYRGGDLPGAWQAIVTALKGWSGIGMRDELQRDVLLFAATTGTPFAAVMKDIEPLLAKGDKALDYKLYTELGFKSYPHAGRWADAIAALDKAVETVGSKVPVEDVPRLRYEQADFAIRLDDPDAVAKYAQQSLAAVSACGGACNAKDTTPIVEAIAGIGRLLGVLYVNDNDPRYYAPAVAIYNAVVPLLAANQALQESTARDKATLDQWKLKLKPNQGKHDKAAISLLLSRHNLEVEGCYEQFLTSNPKLGGTLTLRLEADQTGVIKGASTEPKAGMADLAAVAGCVGEHARSWKLPTHGAPGVTRITLSYALAPKTAASPTKP